jgi:hypothetical protein
MRWQPASTIPKDGTVIIVYSLKSISCPIFWGCGDLCGKEDVELWWCVDGGAYSDDDESQDALGWIALPSFPDLKDFYEKVQALKGKAS